MELELLKEDFERGRAWMREKAPAFADKLAPLYQTARQRWQPGDETTRHIPDRDEILKLILSLIDGLAVTENDGGFIRSGGVEVGVVRDGKTSFEALMRYTVSEHLFEPCANPNLEDYT